jgi:hypothetical protein
LETSEVSVLAIMDEFEKRVLDWLANHPTQELEVVSSAPIAFIIAVLLVCMLIFCFLRWWFQHEIFTRDGIISLRDAAITTHEERHKLKDEQIAMALAKAASAPSVDVRADLETLKAALIPPEPLVILEGTKLDPRVPESNKGIIYKAKVIASFINRSDRAIYVMSPSWISSADDIGTQSPFQYRYRLNVDGQEKEFTETRIEPNAKFNIWVGLDKTFPHDELEKRRAKSQLGVLRIPLKVDGKEASLVYRL